MERAVLLSAAAAADGVARLIRGVFVRLLTIVEKHEREIRWLCLQPGRDGLSHGVILDRAACLDACVGRVGEAGGNPDSYHGPAWT